MIITENKKHTKPKSDEKIKALKSVAVNCWSDCKTQTLQKKRKKEVITKEEDTL